MMLAVQFLFIRMSMRMFMRVLRIGIEEIELIALLRSSEVWPSALEISSALSLPSLSVSRAEIILDARSRRQ